MGLMRWPTPIWAAMPATPGEHPRYNTGPVCPSGRLEPCWTSRKPGDTQGREPRRRRPTDSGACEELRTGWIAFSAKATPAIGLFVCRPTVGSPASRTRPTTTSGRAVFAQRPAILYYRLPKSEPLDNNTTARSSWSSRTPMAAKLNARPELPLGHVGTGRQPDRCLAGGSIWIVDLATRKTVRDCP